MKKFTIILFMVVSFAYSDDVNAQKCLYLLDNVKSDNRGFTYDSVAPCLIAWNTDALKYYIGKGLNVNSYVTEASISLVNAAAMNGDLDFVKFLVSKGAIVTNTRIELECSVPILVSAVQSGNLELVKYFVDKGNPVTMGEFAINNSYFCPLSSAVNKGDFEIFMYLINKGATTDIAGFSGRDLLMEATYSGNIDIVKYLIENGADINARTSDGQTPLSYALRQNHTHIADYLRANGAELLFN
ncbi:MAG: hypothetical protein ATN36_03795 [Epulopiscium sp. Nele67-Bin005]|nr:MAG: hypothetical protein ATN36_03795 [Epulopiscium sp. Nele67-Bin005]